MQPLDQFDRLRFLPSHVCLLERASNHQTLCRQAGVEVCVQVPECRCRDAISPGVGHGVLKRLLRRYGPLDICLLRREARLTGHVVTPPFRPSVFLESRCRAVSLALAGTGALRGRRAMTRVTAQTLPQHHLKPTTGAASAHLSPGSCLGAVRPMPCARRQFLAARTACVSGAAGIRQADAAVAHGLPRQRRRSSAVGIGGAAAMRCARRENQASLTLSPGTPW